MLPPSRPLPRPLFATAAVAFVALSLACGGWMSTEPTWPTEERGVVDELDGSVPEVFQGMDLPYYGGQVEFSFERSMTVSYDPEVDVAFLKREWPAALEAAGWNETDRSDVEGASLLVSYELPDGRTAALTVRPEGTLWWVILRFNDA